MARELTLPVSAERLVPHRDTMLLLDELTESGGAVARTSACFAAGHPFADERGRVESVALIELLAQSAAALKGCEATDEVDAEPRIGYLAGLKQFRIMGCAHAERALQMEVQETFAMDQVAMIDGSVHDGERTLATGTLKVWTGVGTPAAPRSSTCSDAGSEERRGQATRQHAGGSALHRAVLDSVVRFQVTEPERSYIGDFRFDPSFIGFHGHFPDAPILPGIVVLHSVLVTCEQGLGRQVRLIEIERAKFSRPVFPGQVLYTEVALTGGDDPWQLRAAARCEGELVADFRCTVRSAED